MINKKRFYMLIATLAASVTHNAHGCVTLREDDLLCSEYPNIRPGYTNGNLGNVEYEYDCQNTECYEFDEWSSCECWDWGAWNSYTEPMTMFECCRERVGNNEDDLHDCMVLSGGFEADLKNPPVGSGASSCDIGCGIGYYFDPSATAPDGQYTPMAIHHICPRCPEMENNGVTIRSTSNWNARSVDECYVPYDSSASGKDDTGTFTMDVLNDCYHPFQIIPGSGW